MDKQPENITFPDTSYVGGKYWVLLRSYSVVVSALLSIAE